MGYLPESELGAAFPPFATFRDYFGFVPNLFRAQTLLPRLIEAEAALASATIFRRSQLSTLCKERLMFVLSAAQGDVYGATASHQILTLLGQTEDRLELLLQDFHQAGLPEMEIALLDLAVPLATGRFETPACGLSDELLLEVIQIAAWSTFRRTLAAGLGAESDFAPLSLPAAIFAGVTDQPSSRLTVRAPDLPDEFPLFQSLHEQIGFVPHVFRAQTLGRNALERQGDALRTIVFHDDILPRARKIAILAHAAGDELTNITAKLWHRPAEFDANDVQAMREQGLGNVQILEAIATTALGVYFHTIQAALGLEPDFIRPPKRLNLFPESTRPTQEIDPDVALVESVRGGNLEAFEDLVNRHSRRLYRTLMGILGNHEEACDAVQETFLKAYRKMDQFQGRSLFSTWLVSIAHNTGVETLRARKPLQSLDADGPESELGFRPRELKSWADNPEQLYSKAEIQSLIEASVLKLPAPYRVVLVLRDMEHLSMEETAASLGLRMPALKSRLLRGRLMLREALAPHFGANARGGAA